MTLAEILASKELGDDQEITLGDKGTFKLGELRGVATERDTFRTERETIARERDDYRGKYDSVSAATAQLLAEAGKSAEREGAEPPPRSIKDQLRDLIGTEEDPQLKALMEDKLFGKALSGVEERAIKKAQERYDALEAKFSGLEEKMTRGFEGMTVAQLSERLERWYAINRSDIPKGQDNKPLSMRQIHDYAVSRNFVKPGTQLLDYDSALESLTEPQRVEAKMTEAEKRGYEKGLEAGRAQAGKVIPIFGDRSAGGAPEEKISTVGKSARAIVEGQIQRGLSDLAQNE